MTKLSPPLAIGGMGGSGTRLIAQIAMDLGFHLGNDLNNSLDNLLAVFLFKHPDILTMPESLFEILASILKTHAAGGGGPDFTPHQRVTIDTLAVLDRYKQPQAWKNERVRQLLQPQAAHERWGWKMPNTYIFLFRLLKYFPDMKYIHVIRSGLDMAYSGNQQQLEFWGGQFFGDSFDLSPRYNLKFWCIAHQRLLEQAQHIPEQFYLLRFEKFCHQPAQELEVLCQFLDIPGPDPAALGQIIKHVRPPRSIGRYSQHDLSLLDPEDIAYVGELGFPVPGE